MNRRNKIYRDYYFGGLLVILLGILIYFFNPFDDSTLLNGTDAFFTLISYLAGNLALSLIFIGLGIIIIILGNRKIKRISNE
jgi:hypothetical protein